MYVCIFESNRHITASGQQQAASQGLWRTADSMVRQIFEHFGKWGADRVLCVAAFVRNVSSNMDMGQWSREFCKTITK